MLHQWSITNSTQQLPHFVSRVKFLLFRNITVTYSWFFMFCFKFGEVVSEDVWHLKKKKIWHHIATTGAKCPVFRKSRSSVCWLCQIILNINTCVECWYPKLNTPLAEMQKGNIQTESCSLSVKTLFWGCQQLDSYILDERWGTGVGWSQNTQACQPCWLRCLPSYMALCS